MADKQDRKFIISEDAWNILQQYAKIAYDKDKNEISGMLCVRKVNHPATDTLVWELFDPVILKQENTGTTTELDKDALTDFYVKTAMKHGEDIRFCWWHSHHTMGAFWSTTDEREINAWKNDSWSLALVINLFEEYCLNVSTWDPIEHSEDVPLEILRNKPAYSNIQVKEYEELCSKPEPIVTNYKGWTRNYKQVNQVGLWKDTSAKKIVPDDVDALASDEVLSWNKHDNAIPYAELHNSLTDEIDETMSDYAEGKITYPKYCEWLKAINLSLKTRDAKMKVIKVKKGELLEQTATKFPQDFIKYESTQVENAYETAMASIETHIYNGGYYGFN